MTELHKVSLEHEGAALEGLIAVPDAPGRHPAVLVMANALGLGEQSRVVARRLAREGYVALATDMYGGGARYADLKTAGEPVTSLWHNPALLRSRIVAWYELLKARAEVDAGRIAAIGYCFGGQCVLELARSGADAKAVVSFHGLLTTKMPAAPGSVKAQVAVYTGDGDPYAPRAQVDAFREEMAAAGARWQITVFGDVLHSFTDPDASDSPGLAYDPLADRISWAGTLALLDAVVKQG